MYYTIYRITNSLNNKTYIGKHQTDNLDDGYMGSGKYLKRAIDKHGIEKFSKEILFVFETESEMNAKEAELVTEEFCSWSNTYNICVGGQGGFSYVNSSGQNIYENHSATAAETIRKNNAKRMEKRLTDPEYNKKYLEQMKISSEKAWKQAKINNPNGTFFGKTHSEETRLKIGQANAQIQKGNGNSQFGTMWITDGKVNKKIKAIDSIPEGWYKGRDILNIKTGI